MADQTSDEDIIQEAYAERLKALFDNYADVAPSDPDGAKAKFVTGVAFLRNLRTSAVQALAQNPAPAVALTPQAKAAIAKVSKKKI